jgi:hypothetical protein
MNEHRAGYATVPVERGRSAAVVAAFVLAALGCWMPTAQATDLGPQPSAARLTSPADRWQFEVTPYGWMINLDGDTTVKGITSSVNATFIDIVEQADTIVALEGRVEARKGKFSLLSVSDYFKATFSQDVTGNAQPIPQLNIDIDASVELDFELILSEFAATFELFNSGQGGHNGWNGGFTALDVVAGGRYNSVEITTDVLLSVGATLTPDIIPVSITNSGQVRGRVAVHEQWVDPFVGLRLRIDSGTGYQFYARGDVGGFGASSDFVWQAIGGVMGQCRCNENLSWVVGYRALDTDYQTGSGTNEFAFDMLIHGPVIGATWRF